MMNPSSTNSSSNLAIEVHVDDNSNKKAMLNDNSSINNKKMNNPLEKTAYGSNINDEIEVITKKRSKNKKNQEPTVPFTVKPIFLARLFLRVGEIDMNLTHKALFRYANSFDWILMTIGLIMAAIGGAAYPLTTVIFGELVNTFTLFFRQKVDPTSPRISSEYLVDEVAKFTLYFVYLAIGSFMATYIYMSTFVHTGERISFKIRFHYLRAVLRQNIAWFDNEGAGSVATRITSDTLLIQDAISDKIPLAVAQICTTLSAFVIAFVKSWKLTLVLLTMFPLIAISAALMNTLAGRFQGRILNAYSSAGTLAEETFSAIRTVVALGAQTRLSNLYRDRISGARKEGVKKAMAVGAGTSVLFFIIYLGYSLAFWYGGRLLDQKQIDSGQVVNVFFAILIGAFSVGQIAPDLQAFASGKGAAYKIYATIDRKPDIDTFDTGLHIISNSDIQGKIEFKDVKFTYPSRPEVLILKGIDLVIEPGKTVALIGASGSGKSTIIQLIERFYDPAQGVVELDGHALNKLDLKGLRRHIGLVSQEPVLFEGSVKDNVAFGLLGTGIEHSEPSEIKKLVEQSCKMANAHDFIQKLPNGYDTQVGERGLLLSGGQKQRIAIARAIVKNPKILLLDEATSALDTASERLVQDALDKAAIGRTTVVIAHRLSTIKNADLIVVMQHGNIIEKGTHKGLIALDSYYKKLVEAQRLANRNESEDRTHAPRSSSVDGTASHLQRRSSKISDKSSFLEKADIESGKVLHMSSWQVFLAIYRLNSPELKYLLPGTFAALVAGLVYPFFAIVFANMIEVFSKTGRELKDGVNFWAIMFVVIALVTFTSNFVMNSLFGLASEHLTERIRYLAFVSILKQDIRFFDDSRHTTGALTASLSTDAQKIQGISGVTLGALLTVFTNLVGGSIVALIYGWKLGLVAIACLPLLVFSGIFRIKILTYFAEKAKGAHERSAQVSCEAVAAIRTVQSLTKEEHVEKNYAKILEQPLKDGIRSAWMNTSLYAMSQCITFLVNALVFYYGGRLIAYEDYELDQMFTVFIAVIFGSMGAGRIFAYSPDLKKAKDAGENIINLLNSNPNINGSSGGLPLKATEGIIEFKDVKFNYPTRPNIRVLQKLNLKVEPGKFVALVGPSGCGKSTTIGLIERFYDCQDGKVLIDNQDISTLNISSLRSQIGLVSQEPSLFDMTIAENISFGAVSNAVTLDEIKTAAQEANIHDFIMSLPQGYNTKVGSKGSQLSGGQKQRIAIARALVRKPKVLLLDEATSALDAESEKVVQEALDKASKGRTTVAIAHRLSTIQKADTIYVFKDGQIVEYGNHQELLSLQGLYYELVQQQNL